MLGDVRVYLLSNQTVKAATKVHMEMKIAGLFGVHRLPGHFLAWHEVDEIEITDVASARLSRIGLV